MRRTDCSRTVEARPIFTELLTWVEEQHKNNLSKEAIGVALRYAAHQLPQLEVYLTVGRVQIDNNLIENAIRPIAPGRKNYLFCGSHEGAKRAAMMYSFLASCKTKDINPWEWLKYVLQNLENYPQKRIHELFPGNWQQEQKSSYQVRLLAIKLGLQLVWRGGKDGYHGNLSPGNLPESHKGFFTFVAKRTPCDSPLPTC